MPDIVIVSAMEFYKVKPGTPVTLSIIIGDGQVGGSEVMWKDRSLASGKVVDVPVGENGDDLRDTELECTTTVRDVNPATNNTSVTYRLAGGEPSPREFLKHATTQPGGRAVYTMSFLFI